MAAASQQGKLVPVVCARTEQLMFRQVSLSSLRKLFLLSVAAPPATVLNDFCLNVVSLDIEGVLSKSRAVFRWCHCHGFAQTRLFLLMRQKGFALCSDSVTATASQVGFVHGGTTYGFASFECKRMAVSCTGPQRVLMCTAHGRTSM